jgi:Cu/Ag efflux pump CusA
MEEPRWVRRLKIAHHRLMRRVVTRGRALLIAALVIGVLALLAFTRFGSELIPPFREGHFVAQVVAPAGTSLSEMTRLGERISRNLLTIDGIDTVSQQVGRAESGEDTWGPNRTEFHIELKPALPASDQIRIEEAIRKTFEGFPGLQSEVVTFLGDRISESFSGETAAVSINVFGPDLDELDQVAAQVAAVVAKVPGAADVKFDSESGLPTITIQPKAEQLTAFGLRPIDVFDAVAVAYEGSSVAQVYDGNQALPVRVTLVQDARRDPETVGQLLIKTPAGRRVPLSVVADVNLDSGRATVKHESGQRRQVVTLNPTTSDLVGFVDQAKQTVAEKLKLPNGVYLAFGGTAAGASTAAHDLIMHTFIAAIGVILMMMLAFPDWRSVGLILINVPFSLVGGVIAAAATGGSLSIGSLVGFVTLFGISARNTIMLIAHYEHLVQVEGHRWSTFTALRGARERLTPILMTAVVTALGLLPLALGSGEAGREVEGPMAIVILGGLMSSTLLNLLVMPALAARYLNPGAVHGLAEAQPATA